MFGRRVKEDIQADSQVCSSGYSHNGETCIPSSGCAETREEGQLCGVQDDNTYVCCTQDLECITSDNVSTCQVFSNNCSVDNISYGLEFPENCSAIEACQSGKEGETGKCGCAARGLDGDCPVGLICNDSTNICETPPSCTTELATIPYGEEIPSLCPINVCQSGVIQANLDVCGCSASDPCSGGTVCNASNICADPSCDMANETYGTLINDICTVGSCSSEIFQAGTRDCGCTGNAHCSGSTPICNQSSHACVSCSSLNYGYEYHFYPDLCTASQACESGLEKYIGTNPQGACGCETGDCSGNTPVCNTSSHACEAYSCEATGNSLGYGESIPDYCEASQACASTKEGEIGKCGCGSSYRDDGVSNASECLSTEPVCNASSNICEVGSCDTTNNSVAYGINVPEYCSATEACQSGEAKSGTEVCGCTPEVGCLTSQYCTYYHTCLDKLPNNTGVSCTTVDDCNSGEICTEATLPFVNNNKIDYPLWYLPIDLLSSEAFAIDTGGGYSVEKYCHTCATGTVPNAEGDVCVDACQISGLAYDDIVPQVCDASSCISGILQLGQIHSCGCSTNTDCRDNKICQSTICNAVVTEGCTSNTDCTETKPYCSSVDCALSGARSNAAEEPPPTSEGFCVECRCDDDCNADISKTSALPTTTICAKLLANYLSKYLSPSLS